MNRRAVTVVIAVLAIIVAAAVYSAVGRAGGLRLRIAIGRYHVHEAPLIVAMEKGYFEDAGLRIELVRYSTGLEMATAISRGDVDIAIAPAGPMIIAASHGAPVEIISLINELGWGIVARPSAMTPGNRIAEGSVIATPGKGSPAWLMAKLLLDREHVRGVRMLKMEPSAAAAALLYGKVDAVSLPEPLPTLLESKCMIKVADSVDIWSKMPGFVVAARLDALKGKKGELKLFLKKASIDVVEDLGDAADMLSKDLNMNTDVVKKALDKLRFDVTLDEGQISKYSELLVEYGAIGRKVSAGDIVSRIPP